MKKKYNMNPDWIAKRGKIIHAYFGHIYIFMMYYFDFIMLCV